MPLPKIPIQLCDSKNWTTPSIHSDRVDYKRKETWSNIICCMPASPSRPPCGNHRGTICLPCASISRHTPAALHLKSPVILRSPLSYYPLWETYTHSVNIKDQLKFRQSSGCELSCLRDADGNETGIPHVFPCHSQTGMEYHITR